MCTMETTPTTETVTIEGTTYPISIVCMTFPHPKTGESRTVRFKAVLPSPAPNEEHFVE